MASGSAALECPGNGSGCWGIRGSTASPPRCGRWRRTTPCSDFGRGAPTLVAGSTWPGDEAVLLRAFAEVLGSRPDARLILVPHEPTPDHLEAVERTASGAGLPVPIRLSAAASPVPVLLVDRVGVLAALYGAGTMAYVGGGYGRAGLHSVLEPAGLGAAGGVRPQLG